MLQVDGWANGHMEIGPWNDEIMPKKMDIHLFLPKVQHTYFMIK
jgi:hypothetical protein